jgi:hypothetical protein
MLLALSESAGNESSDPGKNQARLSPDCSFPHATLSPDPQACVCAPGDFGDDLAERAVARGAPAPATRSATARTPVSARASGVSPATVVRLERRARSVLEYYEAGPDFVPYAAFC